MSATTKSFDKRASQHQALVAASARLAPGLVALLFGGFIVLAVGFASPSALHDAAHDGRHALSFPCH
jgi:cobalt transporter subunit CbtB